MKPLPATSPAATDAALEAEIARLAAKYKVWMAAPDIALEEGVSVDTAARHLAAGRYGPMDQLPGGGKRVLTQHYLRRLRERTRIFKATA